MPGRVIGQYLTWTHCSSNINYGEPDKPLIRDLLSTHSQHGIDPGNVRGGGKYTYEVSSGPNETMWIKQERLELEQHLFQRISPYNHHRCLHIFGITIAIANRRWWRLRWSGSLLPLKVCIYKVGARASGMGARNKFYLVWHLCTNHGAHIFT
jgi:hypothetical protein